MVVGAIIAAASLAYSVYAGDKAAEMAEDQARKVEQNAKNARERELSTANEQIRRAAIETGKYQLKYVKAKRSNLAALRQAYKHNDSPVKPKPPASSAINNNSK